MGLTVTEDVVVKIQNFPVDVYDSATVTESIGRNLICLIKPITLTTPQLWSKLESASDVTSPEVGTGGAVVGSPTYVAAKFGNGIFSDVNDEGCTFPTAANNINIDKGTIEIWAKVNFETTEVDYHDFIWCSTVGSNGGIRLLFSPTIDDFWVIIQVEGVEVLVIATTGLSWSSGDLLHFGLTWDREGNDIGGGKTLALYVNNSLEASSTDTWNTDTLPANICVGYRPGQKHSDAVIDNIKTYNTCKIDFSDKETEGLTTGPVESVTLSESLSFTGVSYIDVNDSAGITDVNAVIVRANFCPRISDSITVTESIGRKLISNISVYDTITATEYISRMARLGNISVSDNVVVTEYIKFKLVNFISESETITISESITMLRSFPGISVSDAITITERIWGNMWQERSKETDEWVERTKETDGWLALDGNGYASIADASQTGLDMGLSDFMVEARVKRSTLGLYETICSKIDSWPYDEGWAFFVNTWGWPTIGISDSVTGDLYGTSDTTITDGLWHSIIAVVDRSSTTGMKLFVGGVEVSYHVQDDATAIGSLDNAIAFEIGGVNGTDDLWTGSIDELRIWNFGVDGLPTDYAAYITWRNANPNAPTSDYDDDSWNTYVTNNLSAYYKLDGDYTDETSNSNDLTAGGSGNSFLSGWVERTKETDEWIERASKEAA